MYAKVVTNASKTKKGFKKNVKVYITLLKEIYYCALEFRLLANDLGK